jgi:hypothetical protein
MRTHGPRRVHELTRVAMTAANSGACTMCTTHSGPNTAHQGASQRPSSCAHGYGGLRRAAGVVGQGRAGPGRLQRKRRGAAPRRGRRSTAPCPAGPPARAADPTLSSSRTRNSECISQVPVV